MGLFTGVVVMMALNMFSLMVLFAGAASKARTDPLGNGSVHSDEASATFSFFMFVLYSVFFVILVKHRDVIIKEDDSDEMDTSTGQMKRSDVPSHPPIAKAVPMAIAPPVSV